MYIFSMLIRTSVANVIRALWQLIQFVSNHYIHVNMYACWEVRQLFAEGR